MSQPGDDVPLAHNTRGATDLEYGLDSSIGDLKSTPSQVAQEFFNPSDGSEAPFPQYIYQAIEVDRKVVKGWKEDADGMLTFTGLFSAVVAALLLISIPDIRPNSQDTSAFYLAQIYQQSSTQPNGSRPSIPSSLSDPTKPFSPSTSSVWVNGLWCLSLVISLSCALLATLLRQWGRSYEMATHPPYSPQKQARIRAFYRRGVEKWRIPKAAEALPVLLHISLFLFFAGLSVFLFGIHRTIFKTVTAWIILCVILYAYLSLFPVMQKYSLYSTPLYVLLSLCLTGIRHLFFRLSSFLLLNYNLIHMLLPCRRRRRRRRAKVHLDDDFFFSRSMAQTAEEYAFKRNPDIDHQALLWTFESLDQDADYEEFFEGLPRLCDSDTGKKLELKERFIEPNKEKLSNALIGFMDRTLVSNLVGESVKRRRMIISTKVIESKSTPILDPSRILRRVLLEDWNAFLECIEFGLFMQNWMNTSNDDRVMSFYAQCVATLTISIIQNRDKRWIQLATVNAQPLSRSLHYNEDYHSILLTNAIYIVRMSVQTYSGSEDTHRNDILEVSQKTLEAVCKLDIRRTLPELQHEFCDLWNKLVNMAQTDHRPHLRFVSTKMLKNIRKLYIALHGTRQTAFNVTDNWDPILDNSTFYPKCTEEGHRSSSLFPDLQVDAPQTQADAPTPSDMPMQLTQPLTQRITSGPSSPPAQPSPSDMLMQPHSPSPLIPSNPTSSPARPPSPSFPVANPYVLAPN